MSLTNLKIKCFKINVDCTDGSKLERPIPHFFVWATVFDFQFFGFVHCMELLVGDEVVRFIILPSSSCN